MVEENLVIDERLLDRNDTKWAHPGFEEEYYIDGRKTVDKLTDPERPYEKRLKSRNKTHVALEEGKPAFFEENPDLAEQGETKDFTVPGCPEEPDHTVRVTVRLPKKRRRKMQTIFYIAGGAMLYGSPYMGPIEEYCRDYNCIVVSPWYRSALDAPFPAAINDCHAAYQWMIEHAEELNVNPDKVVLAGMSAGAYLALAFAFRLKRYGYKPRGVVSLDPIFSDDPAFLSNHYRSDNWDSDQMNKVMNLYLGEGCDRSAVSPEALVDNATIEDCRGLAPIVIHTTESDAGRDPAMAFMSKLYQAGTYAEIHQWGGACHATLYNAPKDNPIRQRYQAVVDGNIRDFLRYDMRRSWLMEDETASEQEE